MSLTRFPLNAPGDFYVADDRCCSCGAPEQEAPDLMAYGGHHCYFRRQPETPDELARAIAAVAVSCCGAVRYAGRDPEVIDRLRRAGRSDGCDHSEP